jgi:hypothetical protein
MVSLEWDNENHHLHGWQENCSDGITDPTVSFLEIIGFQPALTIMWQGQS